MEEILAKCNEKREQLNNIQQEYLCAIEELVCKYQKKAEEWDLGNDYLIFDRDIRPQYYDYEEECMKPYYAIRYRNDELEVEKSGYFDDDEWEEKWSDEWNWDITDFFEFLNAVLTQVERDYAAMKEARGDR